MTLFSIKNDKFLKYSMIQDSNTMIQDSNIMITKISLHSPYILYIPQIYLKLLKFFNSLFIINIEETRIIEKNTDIKSKINLKFTVKNLLCVIKQSLQSDKYVQVELDSTNLETNEKNETVILLEGICCNTDHNITKDLHLHISIVDNKLYKINAQIIDCCLNAEDYKLFLSFTGNESKPQKIKKPEKTQQIITEYQYEISVDSIIFSLINEKETIKAYLIPISLVINQNNFESLANINIVKITIMYQESLIVDMFHKENQPFIVIQSESKSMNLSINAEIMKIIYNMNSVLFLQTFLNDVSEPVSGIKEIENNDLLVYQATYKIFIKECQFIINFDNQEICCNQELTVKYKTKPYKVSLRSLNTRVYKEHDIISPTNIYFKIISSAEDTYKLTLKDLEIALSLNELLFLQKFMYNGLPQKKNNEVALKTGNNQKSINYFIEFSCIKFKFLSNNLDPLIEILIKNHKSEGKYSKSLNFHSEIRFSIEYYNPVLRDNESLLEPINFSIDIVSGTESSCKIKAVEPESLNINITDFMINHCFSLLSDNLTTKSAFSIYNNTGYAIILHSNDSEFQKIEDKSIENFEYPNEKTNIGCMIVIDNSFTPFLSKIPLFSQDIQSHTLDEQRDIKINTEIRIVGFSKQLKISSHLEIKNNTDLDLDVIFLIKGEVFTIKKVGPGCINSVPFDYNKLHLCITPPNCDINQCERIKLEEILIRSVTLRSDNIFFFIRYSNHTIHIRPSLIIYNYLPCYVFLTFDSSNSNDNISSMLVPGEKENLYISTIRPTKLSINLKGYFPQENLIIFSEQKKHKFPESITFTNQAEFLEIGSFYSTEPNKILILYPLMLLVNLTMLPLEYVIVLKDSMMPLLDHLDDSRVACSLVDKLRIKIESGISDIIDIKNNAEGFTDIINSSTNFSLVYTTKTVKIPEQNLFTKAVIFNSRILITNYMDQNLRAMQSNASEKNSSFIQAGKSNYFNWSSYNTELYMSIIVEDDYCD